MKATIPMPNANHSTIEAKQRNKVRSTDAGLNSLNIIKRTGPNKRKTSVNKAGVWPYGQMTLEVEAQVKSPCTRYVGFKNTIPKRVERI